MECYRWPLFEVENGEYEVNMKPEDTLPIAEWGKLLKLEESTA